MLLCSIYITPQRPSDQSPPLLHGDGRYYSIRRFLPLPPRRGSWRDPARACCWSHSQVAYLIPFLVRFLLSPILWGLRYPASFRCPCCSSLEGYLRRVNEYLPPSGSWKLWPSHFLLATLLDVARAASQATTMVAIWWPLAYIDSVGPRPI